MKFRVELRYPDGEIEPNNEVFNTEEEAEQYGLDFCGNMHWVEKYSTCRIQVIIHSRRLVATVTSK